VGDHPGADLIAIFSEHAGSWIAPIVGRLIDDH
jgi:hypothetical protein